MKIISFEDDLPLVNLPKGKHKFRLEGNRQQYATIADRLGLVAVEKLTAELILSKQKQQNYGLYAKIYAQIVQICVLSLAPVSCILDFAVKADFVHQPFASLLPNNFTENHLIQPKKRKSKGKEFQRLQEEVMLQDEPDYVTTELVCLGEIIVQELSLALPLAPRSSDISDNILAQLTHESCTESIRGTFAEMDAKIMRSSSEAKKI